MNRKPSTYIGGVWAEGSGTDDIVVASAADGSELARSRAAGAADVDAAVRAARDGWPDWAATPVPERTAVLRRLADLLDEHADDLGRMGAQEIGSPIRVAAGIHARLPALAIREVADQMEVFPLREDVGNSAVLREPRGVAAAVSAWNFPLYQFATKVAPAIAAGCTVVAKPSELAPLTPIRFFELLAAAGLPPGVANLVVGTGPEVGEPLVAHPEVDVVSFTGSTQVGRRVGELAGRDVKRVALELGGKSANLLLRDADLSAAIPESLRACLINNGQTCAALTRLVVPRARLAEVEEALVAGLAAFPLGHPLDERTGLGPVISEPQHRRVNGYIEDGVAAGARLLTGGSERPADLPEGGHYVRPTVFSDVTPDMRIAREEIFGPVLCVLPVDSEDAAVEVANGTVYGLSGAVWSSDEDRAFDVARRLRTGQVAVNGGGFNIHAPFGGYNHSGVGREGGRYGIDEYLETKAVQL